MSSIVAGICEETGFRGYMQVPLEKKYGPGPAIILTSVVFMLIHLSHSWAAPILPHIFFASVLLGILSYKSGSLLPGMIGHSILDIFDYAVWWTDLTGGFQKQTLFKTGIDLHFVIWTLVFLIAIFVFFRAIARLKNGPGKAGGQSQPGDISYTLDV
jgi:membrane protease YdiL (CAAX protease family)